MNTLLRQEIFETPTALNRFLEHGTVHIRAAAEAMRNRKLRQIILTGCGTSYYAALAACTHGRTLAGLSGPAIWATPGGNLMTMLPPLGPQDAIIAISASGETRDMLTICDAAGPALVIGLTNSPNSSLAGRVDETLLTCAGEQRVLSASKTFAASVLALHALWAELFSHPEPALADAPNVAQATLDAFEAPMAALAETLTTCPYTYLYGTGPAWAVAQEGALKLKEITGLRAEGIETRELMQGVLPIIGPETTVIAIAPPNSGAKLTLNAADHCRQLGATVHTIGPLPRAWPGILAGIQYGIPFYLLCAHLAEQLGLDANNPAWRERYYSATRH